LETHVYIDGFNLYYGLLRGTPHKWLDLERFCDQLLPKNDVRKIYYFTAKVDARPHDPDQPTRQLAYLHALETFPRVEVHRVNRQILMIPRWRGRREHEKTMCLSRRLGSDGLLIRDVAGG
jgi:hypothetical protein